MVGSEDKTLGIRLLQEGAGTWNGRARQWNAEEHWAGEESPSAVSCQPQTKQDVGIDVGTQP